MPKVSVIMPAYNAENYIREAIDSILAQSFTDFEFIIINDSSKDCTEQIVLSYHDDRIVYVKNERNLGVAETLNKGLKLAQGEYIARMDADDVSLPERLAQQVSYLDANRNTAVLGTGIELFGDAIPTQRRIFAQSPEQMKMDLFFSCGLAHPSVMMRRQVICTLGGYDASFEGLEDYELWCRVVRQYEITTLPEVLFRYRVHGNQVTKNPSEKFMQRFQNLKQRQLMEWGVPAQGRAAESYYRYCSGEKLEDVQSLRDFSVLLESVLKSEEAAKQYDQKLLRHYLKFAVSEPTSRISLLDAFAVCKESELVTVPEVMLRKIRRKLLFWR